MAKSNAVWGIDLGHCALKALRCTVSDDGESVVADAFDYIEYPKVLSQPDAEPAELIREALEQFLSRNTVRGDKVAISVAGQSGLSRFFKPPPVDAKMIPEIVKYEARQQIPFALEDVIWDFQQMGGTEVDGFTLEAEVGLFAMKRDAVFRALQPFLDAEIEVDIVQLAPLSVFNLVLHEVLTDVPEPEEIDPENPPASMIVLSMGTDATDLVITNGTRLWQRSIPLGGNHFTKQLTKELKLTYAKAEHLKRNARQAEDPKTVFQVMRPVFNDLVTEIQRSITYFQSIDRQATIGRMVLLGNAVKLPGLRQYLAKNLGVDAEKIDSFKHLTGATVVSSPSFKENALSYGVCYGLCLQGLGKGYLKTNLLPREFLTERLIREKKPWALAAVGALLLGLSINFYFHYNAWYKTSDERQFGPQNLTWVKAKQDVDSVAGTSATHLSQDTEQMNQLKLIEAIGEEVVGTGDRKTLWIELSEAIDQALPEDPRFKRGESPDPKKIPYADREDLQIEYVESQFFPDLATWFNDDIKERYLQEERLYQREYGRTAKTADEGAGEEDASTTADGDGGAGAETATGPTGPGWVVELKGFHFHNSDKVINNMTAMYVRNTLLKNLREKKVTLPGPDGAPVEFTFPELGIGYAIIIKETFDRNYKIKNPDHPDNMSGNRGGGAPGDATSGFPPGGFPDGGGRPAKSEEKVSNEPLAFPAPRCDFVVQFVWQPHRLSERMKIREEERKKKEAAEKAKAAAEANQSNQAAGTEGGV